MKTFKSEKAVQNSIVKYLKTVDGLYYCKHSERYFRGVPDITGCYKGKFFAIEVKNEKGGVISPTQRSYETKIKNSGGEHIYATSLKQVVDLITSM